VVVAKSCGDRLKRHRIPISLHTHTYIHTHTHTHTNFLLVELRQLTVRILSGQTSLFSGRLSHLICCSMEEKCKTERVFICYCPVCNSPTLYFFACSGGNLEPRGWNEATQKKRSELGGDCNLSCSALRFPLFFFLPPNSASFFHFASFLALQTHYCSRL